MKISKLLNKKNIIFFLFLISFNNSIANEPVDIWNIDKTKTDIEQTDQSEILPTQETSEQKISIYDLNSQNTTNNQNNVFLENNLENKISLYGLYDPDENNLSIEMWSESDGEEIKKIFEKIYSQNLSNDALDILETVLLTNSNTPIKNINEQEFYEIQKKIFVKKKRFELN